MILIDSNVPMYLVGQSHPHKNDARRLLEELVTRGKRLATDTEVLQEILHRYTSIDRRDAIQPAFDALLGVVDEVIPVTLEICQAAKAMVLGIKSVSARDSIHAAVMKHHRIQQILSFDQDFDRIPGIARVPF